LRFVRRQAGLGTKAHFDLALTRALQSCVMTLRFECFVDGVRRPEAGKLRAVDNPPWEHAREKERGAAATLPA